MAVPKDKTLRNTMANVGVIVRKLEYLVASTVLALSVSYPHVAIRIDADAVGHYQQSAAKVVQYFPGLIELE